MAGSFQDIIDYFEGEHEGYFTADHEESTAIQTIRGENGSYKVRVWWDEEWQRIHFEVRDIMTIPKDKRTEAAVFANLVNWSLAIGNFEMDMSDGELMLNLTFDVADGTLGYEQIDAHFNLVSRISDKYYPGFQKLIWGDLPPEDALAFA